MSRSSRHRISAFGMEERICLLLPPTCLNPDVQHRAWLPFSVPPSVKRCLGGTGIINPFPIAYAFRPRLRGRLTLSRLTLPRKPWVYGEQVSHLFYRYSCPHIHFQDLQPSSRLTFSGDWNAPLPPPVPSRDPETRSFGGMLSPDTFSARDYSTSKLLRTFSRMAASKPTSWLS